MILVAFSYLAQYNVIELRGLVAPLTGETMATYTVRDERTFERFSRGAALVRAIHSIWEQTDALYAADRFRIDRPVGEIVAENIRALMSEYDLTYEEWYYWSDIARGYSQ